MAMARTYDEASKVTFTEKTGTKKGWDASVEITGAADIIVLWGMCTLGQR